MKQQKKKKELLILNSLRNVTTLLYDMLSFVSDKNRKRKHRHKTQIIHTVLGEKKSNFCQKAKIIKNLPSNKNE